MRKLKIIDINNYDYTLIDEDGNIFTMNIGFLGLESNPTVDDYIYIPENILNEVNFFSFGVINDSNVKDKDLIKIVSKNKQYYLQRYYG